MKVVMIVLSVFALCFPNTRALAGGGTSPALPHRFTAEEATGEDWVKLQDRAHGSNDIGQRIYNQYSGGQLHAGLSNPDGTTSLLESLPGTWESAGQDINNHGIVVGRAEFTSAPLGHAILWAPGETPRDIGPLGDDFQSWAQSINDYGDATVTVHGGPLGLSNLWGGLWHGKSETLYRLDDWIVTPNVHITESFLVNNAGYILADGYLDGKKTAIRLSPYRPAAVPEPATLPLILGGVTLLAPVLRRRR